MIQFNFKFKRKFSGFNSKNYSIRKKCHDSIQKNYSIRKKRPDSIFNSKLFWANSIQQEIQFNKWGSTDIGLIMINHEYHIFQGIFGYFRALFNSIFEFCQKMIQFIIQFKKFQENSIQKNIQFKNLQENSIQKNIQLKNLQFKKIFNSKICKKIQFKI